LHLATNIRTPHCPLLDIVYNQILVLYKTHLNSKVQMLRNNVVTKMLFVLLASSFFFLIFYYIFLLALFDVTEVFLFIDIPLCKFWKCLSLVFYV